LIGVIGSKYNQEADAADEDTDSVGVIEVVVGYGQHHWNLTAKGEDEINGYANEANERGFVEG
jgi:hypothetical protein